MIKGIEQLPRLLAMEDVRRRFLAYPNAAMRLLGEMLVYGRTNNPGMIPALRMLYGSAVEDCTVQEREEIYEFLLDFAEKKRATPNVLVPFMGSEPVGYLASRAVIDFCMIAAAHSGKPEEGMWQVGGIMRSGQLENLGAVFGGLLCLGDRRAHPYLLEVRPMLAPEDVDQVVRTFTGFLSAATVEFYLDWMEECRRDFNDRLFGALAAGLVNQVSRAQQPYVMTGERDLPPGRLPREVAERREAWVPLEDYAQQIAPRLLALDAAEPEPKVMPDVLEAWGIEA